ncbi:MAG: S-formylglutathione hydrolase [Myxococcales bacterium]|nr:S-formylglutathione hydrolase [Myxococcales bacterium]
MERVSRARSFGGWQEVWSHRSEVLSCDMRFGVYTPPRADVRRCPVVMFLSGLTCTEDNFVVKAGAQRVASELGLILVAPDTSPRGDDVADDPGWDLGKGAGFYVNATQAPWSSHYRMHDYVADELPALLRASFAAADLDRLGLFGHSMGGHGALVTAFRHPERYRSVSAFAPIVAPAQVPWGHKAFGAYLGEDRATWAAWDACELAATTSWRRPILVDQGTSDSFLEVQLQPHRFVEACARAGIPLTLRLQDGYDHGYHFISSFVEDHLRHHAAALERP